MNSDLKAKESQVSDSDDRNDSSIYVHGGGLFTKHTHTLSDFTNRNDLDSRRMRIDCLRAAQECIVVPRRLSWGPTVCTFSNCLMLTVVIVLTPSWNHSCFDYINTRDMEEFGCCEFNAG